MASQHGQMAYASGTWELPGEAQASLYVLRAESFDTDWCELFLDGAAKRLTIPRYSVWAFHITVAGFAPMSVSGEAAAFSIRGAAKKKDPMTSVAFVGVPSKEVLGQDDATWDCQVATDAVNDALVIRVRGGSNRYVRWSSTVRTTEVKFY